MEETTPVVADHRQADDLADSWRTRQRDFLLSLGVGKRRRDRLAGLGQLAAQHERAVLARGHQVKLIADSLAAFDGQRQKLAKLVVRRPRRAGYMSFKQAGEHLLDAPHVSAGDPGLGGRGIHQLVAALQRARARPCGAARA